MKTIISLLFMIIVITGCQKQINESPTTGKTQSVFSEKPLQNIADDSPGNPANPYDSVGIMHNILLSEAHQYMINTGDTNKVSIQSHVTDFYKKSRRFDSRYLERATPGLQNAVLLQPAQLALSFNMPPLTRTFITELVTILRDTKGLDYFTIKGKIVLLESRGLSNSSLSLMDKRALLSTTSVARFSSYYWLNWAKSKRAQRILSTKFKSQSEALGAMSFAYDADCFAVWVAWWNGWIHWASAEQILAFSSAVSAMAYLLM